MPRSCAGVGLGGFLAGAVDHGGGFGLGGADDLTGPLGCRGDGLGRLGPPGQGHAQLTRGPEQGAAQSLAGELLRGPAGGAQVGHPYPLLLAAGLPTARRRAIVAGPPEGGRPAGRCRRDPAGVPRPFALRAGALPLMRHEALRRIPSSAGRNSKGGFWVQWLTPIRKVTGTRACQESGGQVQVSEMMRRGTRVIWRKLDCLISQSPDDAKNHPSERYLKPAPCSVPTL